MAYTPKAPEHLYPCEKQTQKAEVSTKPVKSGTYTAT